MGYAAALWAFVFTFLHVVWAAGSYLGLPEAEARLAFGHPWFRVYDLVIAGLWALGGLVALALVQPWGRRVPRRPLLILAWAGTAVLILRGGGGVLQTSYWMITRRYVPSVMDLYEVWFCLGAVLFAVSLRRFGRTEA